MMAAPNSNRTREEAKMDQLISACQQGDAITVEHLLSEGDSDIFLNRKTKGTTPLHVACCYGRLNCVKVLLKCKADLIIWDVRGFSAIHSAVYNNHQTIVQQILSWKTNPCDVNCLSNYGETPLLIACMRGHYELAKLLVEEKQANVCITDKRGNTALIMAAGSNNMELLQWLLTFPDIREGINTQNKFGWTAAHQACLLGCKGSVSVLVSHDADFSLHDSNGHSSLDIVKMLGNDTCFKIATKQEDCLPLPPLPKGHRDVGRSGSSDSFLAPPFLAQRSHGSGGDSSSYSLSNSQGVIQRCPSLTGMSRPLNLMMRRSSQKRGSVESTSMYITMETATKISRNLEHQDSKGWDEAHQVVYDNTAFEPPPDIIFIPPVKRASLTKKERMVYSNEHDLKVRISANYWDPKKPDEQLDVCLAATMHFNRSFPQGYTIVSPVCFLSCKTNKVCEVRLTIPHATLCQFDEDHKKIVILSTAAYDNKWSPDSPLFSPGDHPLVPLHEADLKIEQHLVKFITELTCPSLYAVAVKENFPCPLPLRCSLFVAYPELDGGSSMVAGFDIVAYVGMALKAVSTAVTAKLAEEHKRFKEVHFTLTSDRVQLLGRLTSSPLEWDIECRGKAEFKYTQLALTQDTDSDSYSLLFAYPPHEYFFIEPRNAVGAVHCRISVADSQRELVSILVVPYSPTRVATPERTPPPSQPTSQTHLVLPRDPILISEV